MRTFTLLLLLFGLPMLLVAQEEEVEMPDLPYNEDRGKVMYEGVVHVKGVSKKDLYERAHSWFKDFYANPSGVMEEKNKEKGMIEGRHRIQLHNILEDGTKVPKGFMNYSIYVFVKKGKFKYRLSEYEKHAQTPIPIEELMEEKNQSTKRKLQEVDDFTRDLIADLKQYMQEAGNKEKSMDEW